MSATPEQIAIDEKALEATVRVVCPEQWHDDPREMKLVRHEVRKTITAYLSATSDAQAERVRVLESALRPFADEAALWADMWADDFHPVQDTSVSCSQCGESMEKPERARFTIGDLRRARAALRGEA